VGINIQNLIRPNKEVGKNLHKAIELVSNKNLSSLKKEFKSPPLEIVGSLLRSVFVAPKGKKLVICDLGAVENRGLGYVAGDETILKVFQEGLDPYVYFAVDLYGEPYEKLLQDKDKRQNAKPAVLGCGYMLSGGEEVVTADGDKIFTGLMGYARNMGIPITQDLADRSVDVFRNKHKKVVQCWYDLENSATRCIKTGNPEQVGPVKFELFGDVLKMVLPSGRCLHYLEPRIVEREWFGKTKQTIECWGIDQKKHIWTRIYTYGGKLMENAVQAISRDILAAGMIKATSIGFPIVMHTHDEIVAEVPIESPLGIKELRECMIERPWWGNENLILDAVGFESDVYKKE
jgi:DNA polymerase